MARRQGGGPLCRPQHSAASSQTLPRRLWDRFEQYRCWKPRSGQGAHPLLRRGSPAAADSAWQPHRPCVLARPWACLGRPNAASMVRGNKFKPKQAVPAQARLGLPEPQPERIVMPGALAQKQPSDARAVSLGRAPMHAPSAVSRAQPGSFQPPRRQGVGAQPPAGASRVVSIKPPGGCHVQKKRKRSSSELVSISPSPHRQQASLQSHGSPAWPHDAHPHPRSGEDSAHAESSRRYSEAARRPMARTAAAATTTTAKCGALLHASRTGPGQEDARQNQRHNKRYKAGSSRAVERRVSAVACQVDGSALRTFTAAPKKGDGLHLLLDLAPIF